MAKQTKLTNLVFPLGGLDRSAGFSNSRPFTTPFCKNVRPFDVVNLTDANMHGMRQRGGARPGISKTFVSGSQPQAGHPFQMLSYASAMGASGVSSNMLLAAVNGVLYYSSGSAMVAATGSLNVRSTYLQGTQLGTKFYVADYRPALNDTTGTAQTADLRGLNGTIASTNRLSDFSGEITDWRTLGIDITKDVVWVSGAVDLESNIFSIDSIAGDGTYIVIDGAISNQASGVVWQIGRLPKIFDPAAPATVLANISGSLPIPRTNYSIGTVTSLGKGWFTSAGGADWSSIPDPVTSDNPIILTLPNRNGIGETDYAVESIDTTLNRLQLRDYSDSTVCTSTNYTLSWTSAYYGIPPLNCPLCCTYRGRLVLAGPGAVWYMSRVLDPQNWDYGYDPQDPARAVAGTSTTTGGIPEPITALIPHSDDYLIFGCERSMWLLNADPAYGGTITALSRDIGVLGPGAWCNLPDGSVVFLSRDGIYYLAAGGRSYPESVSREKLPAELLNVDWVANTISMSYDVVDRGIHLSITPIGGTVGTHWFIDWTTKSFWPTVFGNNNHQPTGMIRYSSGTSDPAKTIIGSFDGYVRNYVAAATTDDGTAISSLVCYGPLDVGGPGYYGELLQISGELDSNGQGVLWGIFSGNTAQAAIQAAVTAGIASSATWNGSWVAGDNSRHYPRAYGGAIVIMVSGTYGWAIENMTIEGRRKGVKR